MLPSASQLAKGIRNPGNALRYLTQPHRYRAGVVAATSRVQLGTSIFDRDWDVCVILDTCRVDALRQLEDEYPFIEGVDRTVSVGGSSPEWMAQTFDAHHEEILEETAYLSANAWIEKVIDERLCPDDEYHDYRILKHLRDYGDWNIASRADFGRLEKIWRYVPEEQQPDKESDPRNMRQGGSPPRYVTDRGVAVWRRFDYDRLILHYMQPHAPYIDQLRTTRELDDIHRDPFRFLEETGERQRVWDAYLNELRCVLDDLQILLSNIDAETVIITADHGEAFGEYGVYKHHSGSLHPKVRLVPWIKTSATDTWSYEPEVEPVAQSTVSTGETLRALGYRM